MSNVYPSQRKHAKDKVDHKIDILSTAKQNQAATLAVFIRTAKRYWVISVCCPCLIFNQLILWMFYLYSNLVNLILYNYWFCAYNLKNPALQTQVSNHLTICDSDDTNSTIFYITNTQCYLDPFSFFLLLPSFFYFIRLSLFFYEGGFIRLFSV